MILLNSSMGQFCELFCLAFNPLLCRSTVLCVLPHLANEEQSLAAFTSAWGSVEGCTSFYLPKSLHGTFFSLEIFSVCVWLCAYLLMPVPQCACGVWKTTFSWFSLFTSFLRPSLLFLLCCVLQASRPTGSSSLFSSHLVTGPVKLEMSLPHSAFSVASWVWTLVLRLLWQARYLLRHIDVSSKHFFLN